MLSTGIQMQKVIRALLKKLLPSVVQRWFLAQQRWLIRWSPIGKIGPRSRLWRLQPFSHEFGFDRGIPIDRYYIEAFLKKHSKDIQGNVLEIGDDYYIKKFGVNQVLKSDILHITNGNSKATIVADLTNAEYISSNKYDCIIFTQTLQFIYDTRRALQTIHRILKPGGILLATFPGISQISRYDMDRWGDYWRFTTLSAQCLFGEFFPVNLSIVAYGNVLSSIAFLHGLASEEMSKTEIDYCDSNYELVITVRAVK